MNRLVMFIALFMTLSTTILLYKVLEEEIDKKTELVKYAELLNKDNICQDKIESLGLLLNKEKI